MKLEALYKRMEVLYRVLTKMYENSEILMEDVKDQVMLKDQERKAIHASNSAMKSAMNVIKGDKDKRYMFDMALEAVADDVSKKVGEMERFMEMSSSFMESVDLQNGVFCSGSDNFPIGCSDYMIRYQCQELKPCGKYILTL